MSEPSPDDIRLFVFMREETRFEIGLLHERINALISAEAFLTIAFTMSLTNSNARFGPALSLLVPPILSLVGLILAVLAWPGVDASFKIIVEWNVRQQQVMNEKPALTDAMWRMDVLGRRNPSALPESGLSLVFARAVPAVFTVAWALLTVVALVLPLRAARQ